MKTLLGYFWRGCLVLMPVGLTIYFGYLVVATFDRLVPVGIPGLGFVLALVLVTLVGFATSNVIGRAVVEVTERWLTSLPLLKLVYGSIRDLIQAFVGDKKRFDQPVALSLVPGSGVRVLGFITRDSLDMLGMSDHIAVYVPQSYNFAGSLILVKREQIERLEASSSDMMAFIVSGGVSGFGTPSSSEVPPPIKPEGRTMLGLGPRRR